MTSAGPNFINDDHGDQFPGAVPLRVRTAPARLGTAERLVRMHAAYAHKINSAVQAGRDDLAQELATTTFDEESARDGARLEHRTTGRSSARTQGGRPPGHAPTGLTRMGRFTRRSLGRLDRYTLEVFNPGHPYRSDDDK